jgi:hypothetical protein
LHFKGRLLALLTRLMAKDKQSSLFAWSVIHKTSCYNLLIILKPGGPYYSKQVPSETSGPSLDVYCQLMIIMVVHQGLFM